MSASVLLLHISLFLQDPTLQSFQTENLMTLADLGLGFLLTLLAGLILIVGMMYRQMKDQVHCFSFLLIGLLLYLFGFITTSIPFTCLLAASIFVTFGLLSFQKKYSEEDFSKLAFLAIFSIIAIINTQISIISPIELGTANLLALASASLFYFLWYKNKPQSHIISFGKINLLRPDRREELLSNLQKKTGLDIKDIEIIDINYLKKVATIKVFSLSKQSADPAPLGFYQDPYAPLGEQANANQNIVLQRPDVEAF